MRLYLYSEVGQIFTPGTGKRMVVLDTALHMRLIGENLTSLRSTVAHLKILKTKNQFRSLEILLKDTYSGSTPSVYIQFCPTMFPILLQLISTVNTG
jgi:hypothetical protein